MKPMFQKYAHIEPEENMISSDEERELWRQIEEIDNKKREEVETLFHELPPISKESIDDALIKRHNDLWSMNIYQFNRLYEKGQLPPPFYKKPPRLRRSCAMSFPYDSSTFILFLYANRTLLKYETVKEIEDYYNKVVRKPKMVILPEGLINNPRPNLSLKMPGVEVEIFDRYERKEMSDLRKRRPEAYISSPSDGEDVEPVQFSISNYLFD